MLETGPFKLVVIGGVSSGQVFPLAAGDATLGRDADNDICVPDLAISRRHCVFTRDAAGWRVRDLGSSNGTFVNSLQARDQLLAEGDQVTAGASVLLYVHGSTLGPPAFDLDEQDPIPTTRLDPAQIAYLRTDAGPRSTNPAKTGAGEAALRLLVAIGTTLNAIRDEAALRRALLDLLFAAVPAGEGAILEAGRGEQLLVQASRTPAGEGPVHVIAATVRRAMSEGVGVLCAGAPQSHLAVPIGVRGRCFGAIYLATRRDVAFTDDHLQLVTAAGQICAVSFENVRHLAALEREADRLRADLHETTGLIGDTPAMEHVSAKIRKVARADTTVLITGETGTGKELAAREIHLHSSRARRPFVAVNCAALTETLLESELFGHERGAFTGAVAQKKGRIELADGGTLFLDEIGELAPALQSKLLRVLQEREFERVGGTRPIKVDIRLLSATNRDLAAEAAAGRFRPDLYFRLKVVTVDLPPLRERRDDLDALADHFIRLHAHKGDRPVTGLSPAAQQCIREYDWPGNVRELENAIEHAIVLGTTGTILPEDLPETILDAASGAAAADEAIGDLHGQVLEVKRRAIIAAFRRAGGSYTEAARVLGVHPNYLHRLIRTLGIKAALEHAGV